MKRTVKSDNTPLVKPVEKVELSEKHFSIRFFIFILLAVFGVAAIAYSINALLTKESGWREIKASSDKGVTCAGDFVFNYDLGSSGVSATVEYKQICAIYTDEMRRAYELFNYLEDFDGVNNVKYINDHPNEEIEVDEMLYEAFETAEKSGSRFIYGGPVYYYCRELLNCDYDHQTESYDPRKNEEMAEYFSAAAKYFNDPEQIGVELLPGSKIRLRVSDAYMDFAEENGMAVFVDFFWLKNAFAADHTAETLKKSGYTRGTISSFDGFCRNLDGSGTEYSYNIFSKQKNTVYLAAKMNYSGPTAIVMLRNYPMSKKDTENYYSTEAGEIYTPYVDISADNAGVCKSSRNELVCISDSKGCAETALLMIPVFISDTFDESFLENLLDEGINSVWCVGNEIRCNGSDLSFYDLYSDNEAGVVFKPEYVGK